MCNNWFFIYNLIVYPYETIDSPSTSPSTSSTSGEYCYYTHMMVLWCSSYSLFRAGSGLVTFWIILLHLDYNCDDRVWWFCSKNYRMTPHDNALCDILCSYISPCPCNTLRVKIPQAQRGWETIWGDYASCWGLRREHPQ